MVNAITICPSTLSPYTTLPQPGPSRAKARPRFNFVTSTALLMSRNARYISEQLYAAAKTTSTITKVFCALLVLGHVASYNRILYNALTLTPLFLPRLFYSFYALFTHAFVETRLIFCLADVLAVCLCGKLIEPLWGSLEMLKFFALVSVCTGFYTTIFYLLAYGLTFDIAYLFDTRIAGLSGYLAGISVAVKQIMPDHVLLSFRNRSLKLRNTHVPLLLFGSTLFLKYSGLVVDYEYIYPHAGGQQQTGGPSPPLPLAGRDHTLGPKGLPETKYYPTPYPWMFMIGLLTSWVYLRFNQKHSNGTRGDMEDSFSFARENLDNRITQCYNSFSTYTLKSFFPSMVQPPIRVVSNVVYEMLVKVKVLKKLTVRKLNDSSYSSVTLNLPGFDTHDAERRRLKAIKALNERLTKNDTDGISWPNLDEPNDNEQQLPETQNMAPAQHETNPTAPSKKNEPGGTSTSIFIEDNAATTNTTIQR